MEEIDKRQPIFAVQARGKEDELSKRVLITWVLWHLHITWKSEETRKNRPRLNLASSGLY